MASDPLPRVRKRRSADEAAALVADWRSSGLTKQAFCRERGLLRSTLVSCLSRVTAAPAGFVEVRPRREPVVGVQLEIEGGLRVTGLDVTTAAALIGALRAVSR